MSNQWNSRQTQLLQQFMQCLLAASDNNSNYTTSSAWESRNQNQANNFCDGPNWQDRNVRYQRMNSSHNNEPMNNQNNFSSMYRNWDISYNSDVQANRNYQHRNAYNHTKSRNQGSSKNTPPLQKKPDCKPPSKITTDVKEIKQTAESQKQSLVLNQPFKSREFMNAKRCIQRLGKLDYDTLEEKQRFRLDNARKTVARIKKGSYQKNSLK